MAKFKSRNRQLFLLSFFPNNPSYEEKEVNGFILIKYFSNATHEWEVQVYTQESFAERQKYLNTVPDRKTGNSGQTTMLDVPEDNSQPR